MVVFEFIIEMNSFYVKKNKVEMVEKVKIFLWQEKMYMCKFNKRYLKFI